MNTDPAFSLSLRRFDTEVVVTSHDPALLSAFAALSPSWVNPYSLEHHDGAITWQLTRVPSDDEFARYGEMLAGVVERVTA